MSEWSSDMGASWSSDYELTDSRISAEGAEVVSSGKISLVVTLLQEPVDLEGGSSVIPKEELLGDPEEEPWGIPRKTFPDLSSP